METFDEKENGFSEVELSKIEFSKVNILLKGSIDFGAKIIVNVFYKKENTPERVVVGIFYEGKLIGSGESDNCGKVVINLKSIPLPEPRDKEVYFEARVKGLAIRSKSNAFYVGKNRAEREKLESEEAGNFNIITIIPKRIKLKNSNVSEITNRKILKLLANSISLDLDEKKRILINYSTLSSDAIDQLIRIFTSEVERFQALTKEHSRYLSQLKEKNEHEWYQLVAMIKKEPFMYSIL